MGCCPAKPILTRNVKSKRKNKETVRNTVGGAKKFRPRKTENRSFLGLKSGFENKNRCYGQTETTQKQEVMSHAIRRDSFWMHVFNVLEAKLTGCKNNENENDRFSSGNDDDVLSVDSETLREQYKKTTEKNEDDENVGSDGGDQFSLQSSSHNSENSLYYDEPAIGGQEKNFSSGGSVYSNSTAK